MLREIVNECDLVNICDQSTTRLFISSSLTALDEADCAATINLKSFSLLFKRETPFIIHNSPLYGATMTCVGVTLRPAV